MGGGKTGVNIGGKIGMKIGTRGSKNYFIQHLAATWAGQWIGRPISALAWPAWPPRLGTSIVIAPNRFQQHQVE